MTKAELQDRFTYSNRGCLLRDPDWEIAAEFMAYAAWNCRVPEYTIIERMVSALESRRERPHSWIHYLLDKKRIKSVACSLMEESDPPAQALITQRNIIRSELTTALASMQRLARVGNTEEVLLAVLNDGCICHDTVHYLARQWRLEELAYKYEPAATWEGRVTPFREEAVLELLAALGDSANGR